MAHRYSILCTHVTLIYSMISEQADDQPPLSPQLTIFEPTKLNHTMKMNIILTIHFLDRDYRALAAWKIESFHQKWMKYYNLSCYLTLKEVKENRVHKYCFFNSVIAFVHRAVYLCVSTYIAKWHLQMHLKAWATWKKFARRIGASYKINVKRHGVNNG